MVVHFSQEIDGGLNQEGMNEITLTLYTMIARNKLCPGDRNRLLSIQFLSDSKKGECTQRPRNLRLEILCFQHMNLQKSIISCYLSS